MRKLTFMAMCLVLMGLSTVLFAEERVIGGVQIIDVHYFAEDCYGGGHKAGQVQIRTNHPEFPLILTNATDTFGYEYMMDLIMLAFKEKRIAYLTITDETHVTAGRWSIRSISVTHDRW